jgi:trk system potassium uptake protein TrkA
MKSILVIGIGRFGRHLSQKFLDMGNEVMVVDQDESNLREILPYATSAQIGDCTDVASLRSLGIANFDLCFVCIGSNFQSSLEITYLLKELGAKRVISKASDDIHAKFLLHNGADEVIDPERDIAEKIAIRYNAGSIISCIDIDENLAVIETYPPSAWIGKSIRELHIRNKYLVNVLAFRTDEQTYDLTDTDYIFKKGASVYLLGRKKDLERLPRK